MQPTGDKPDKKYSGPIAWMAQNGVAANVIKPIPIKTHGRKAASLFAHGVSVLRKIFSSAQSGQIFTFLCSLMAPKMPHKPLQCLRLQ